MNKICWVVIGILVSFMFRSNFYFSESYDVLALNHIDDINFHVYLQTLRERLAVGDWRAIFASTGFAYGNIYWTPLLLITWPFANWGPAWLNIVVARELSVIGYGLCLLAVYKISRARNYSRNNSSLGLLLLATCSGIYYAATCFHNHMFISGLILWSFYFLIVPPSGRRVAMACILFGMALGLKVSAVFALPLFLIFLNRHRSFKLSDWLSADFFIMNLKVVLAIFATAIISFSPTVLLLPFGDRTFFDSLSPLHYILFVAPTLVPPREVHFFEELWENAMVNYYHALILVTGIGSALWLVYQNRKRNLDDILMPICCIVSSILIAVLGSVTIRDAYFLRFYILPFIFIFGFVFVDLAHRYRKSAILILIISLNLYLNFTTFRNYFFMQPEIYAAPETQSQISRLAVLRQQVPIKLNDIVYIDMRVIFPFGPIEHFKNVRYVYDQRVTPQPDGDIYIYSKSNKDVPPEISQPLPPYVMLYSDADIQIVRNQRDIGKN